MPGLTDLSLGIGEAVLATGLLGMVFKDLPRWHGEPDEPLSWRLTHVVPGALIAALATIGAIATIITSAGGLYWFAGAMAVAISSGSNSWVLLVEIKR